MIYTGYLPGLYGSARGGYYKDFSYAIPVSNGLYTVTLKFAEIEYSGVGQRVFNVSLNGTRVLTNFDLVAQGAYFTPLDRPFPVTVTDGIIRLSAQGVTRAALLNAIQIVPAPGLQVSPGTCRLADLPAAPVHPPKASTLRIPAQALSRGQPARRNPG